MALVSMLHHYNQTMIINMRFMNFFLKVPTSYYYERMEGVKTFMDTFNGKTESEERKTNKNIYLKKKIYKNALTSKNLIVLSFLIVFVMILVSNWLFINFY